MDGAAKVLHRYYYSKVFAKVIWDLRDVLYLKYRKELGEAVMAMMDWEGKLIRVEKNYGMIPGCCRLLPWLK